MSAAAMLAAPLVRRFEGFRAVPYRCPAGRWTIGYGATRYADGRAVAPGDPPLDEAQAAALLQADLDTRWRAMGGMFAVAPAPQQGAAMLSLCFNIGLAAFAASSLLKAFNRGDLRAAADAFLAWNKADTGSGLTVLDGLTRRRRAERALFLGDRA